MRMMSHSRKKYRGAVDESWSVGQGRCALACSTLATTSSRRACCPVPWMSVASQTNCLSVRSRGPRRRCSLSSISKPPCRVASMPTFSHSKADALDVAVLAMLSYWQDGWRLDRSTGWTPPLFLLSCQPAVADGHSRFPAMVSW